MINANTISERTTFQAVINIPGMDTLGSRIARHRKAAGISQLELAKRCGWASQSRIGNYEKGLREPSLDDITLIAEKLGIKEVELLLSEPDAGAIPPGGREGDAASNRGRGTARETGGAYHPGLTPISAWDDDTPLDDDEVEVPFLKEVELSAGSGRTVIQESSRFKLRFGKYTLRRHNVQPEHAVCVPINGNSMEPVLRSGATVGVDRSKTQVIDGDLYAINHAGQLRVKQVYRLPGGGIRLRSFNRDEHPDEEYTLDQMEAMGISLIGRVFWGAMFF